MAQRQVAEAVQGTVAAAASFYLNLITFLAAWALLPLVFGWLPTVAMTGSMEPAVRVGDLIVAQPVSQDDIHSGMVGPGLVVLADNPLADGELFTHRVMSVRPDGRFVTKGDNNGSLDPEPLSPANIRGIERMKVPLVGLPIQGIHAGNPAPLVVFIAITSLAVLAVRLDKVRTQSREVHTARSEA